MINLVPRVCMMLARLAMWCAAARGRAAACPAAAVALTDMVCSARSLLLLSRSQPKSHRPPSLPVSCLPHPVCGPNGRHAAAHALPRPRPPAALLPGPRHGEPRGSQQPIPTASSAAPAAHPPAPRPSPGAPLVRPERRQAGRAVLPAQKSMARVRRPCVCREAPRCLHRRRGRADQPGHRAHRPQRVRLMG